MRRPVDHWLRLARRRYLRWQARADLLCVQLILLPAALVSLYLKYREIGLNWWFLEPGNAYNLRYAAPYLRYDAWLGLILLPVAVALLGRLFRRSFMLVFAFYVSLSLVLTYFVQLRAYYLLENFAPAAMLWEAVRWGARNPGLASQYIELKSLLKLAVLVTATAFSFWVASSRRPGLERLVRPGFVPLAMAFELALAVMPLLIQGSGTRYDRPVLLQILSAMAGAPRAPLVPLAGLRKQYGALAAAPREGSGSPYWGACSGCDVILFVMETCPAQCLPLEGDLSEFPALRRLRGRSWVSTRHYTTHPFTSSALYSIVTGMYPQDQIGRMESFRQQTGLIRILGEHGYVTTYGTGMETFERHLEAQKTARVTTSACYMGAESIRTYSPDWLRKQIQADERCLELFLKDRSHWSGEGRRYVAILAPQTGHGPWQDVRDPGIVRDPLDRCRDLAAL